MSGTMMTMPLNVCAILDHAARAFPAQTIVSVGADGTRSHMRYDQMAIRSRRLASALSALGVSIGTRVATLAWNTHRHLELYFAIPGVGAVCHTLNPRLSVDALTFILNEAGSSILFFDAEFAGLAATLLANTGLTTMVLMDERSAAPSGDTLVYEELIAASDPIAAWVPVAETAAAALCYTSGTTGNPKGVAYTHRSLVLHTLVCALPTNLGIAETDCVLPVVPMFHVNAWTIPHIALLSGARLVLPRQRLDGESLRALFDAEGVSVAVGVPTVWTGLLGAIEACGSPPAALRRLFVAGSALQPGLLRGYDRFGIDVIQAWGMTETSPACTINPGYGGDGGNADDAEELRLAQGRPVFGVELDFDADVAQGLKGGEILVRGHWIANGYFGHAPLFDDWLRTGDVGYIDATGRLRLTDRVKDLIKSGGEWISSVELETLAAQVDGVETAVAIGVPDERWGERPVLLIRPKAGASLSAQTIIDHLAAHLPSWQVPDSVQFVDQFPIGATGKVLKREVRASYDAGRYTPAPTEPEPLRPR